MAGCDDALYKSTFTLLIPNFSNFCPKNRNFGALYALFSVIGSPTRDNSSLGKNHIHRQQIAIGLVR